MWQRIKATLAWLGALAALVVSALAAIWAARKWCPSDPLAEAETAAIEEIYLADDHARQTALAELAVIHTTPDPVDRDRQRRAWVRRQVDAAAARRGRDG